MDVGYFISELLGQHGSVAVPGLGYFAHTRVSGYYNDAEGKFYPPGYTVKFEADATSDETLAVYIAGKKNISLESASYFIEKFAGNIKSQAETGEAAIADLGWFYKQEGQLLFKPNNNLNTDPEFFGYPAVTLNKISIQPVAAEPEEAVDIPVEAPAPVVLEQEEVPRQIETSEAQEVYIAEETDKKRNNTTIILIVLGVLLVALVVFLVSRYNPSLFNREKLTPAAAAKDTVVRSKATPLAADTAKTDTTDHDTMLVVKKAGGKDTSIKITTRVNDSIPLPRYEIMGGSFKDLKEATWSIGNYKKLGVTARVAEGVPGKRVKITLGTYKTRAEAESARKDLIKKNKVSKDIYTLEIKRKL
jgi:cell division protein FtsN